MAATCVPYELAVGVLRDQPGVLCALLADDIASGPPDLIDDLAQAAGVRGSYAGNIEPLLKRYASRECPVAGRVNPLILGSHRRKLSRQLIIHATDAMSRMRRHLAQASGACVSRRSW